MRITLRYEYMKSSIMRIEMRMRNEEAPVDYSVVAVTK